MLLVIDGNNMLWRIIRSKGFPELQTSLGQSTGGIFGFLRSVRMLLNEYQPASVVVVFDGGISKRRRKLNPAYKQHVSKTKEDHEDFVFQSHCITKFLSCVGIGVVRLPDREADDIIGYIPRLVLDAPLPANKILVVSEDIDLYQVLRYSRPGLLADLTDKKIDVKLYRPIASILVTPENVDTLLGFHLDHYALYKALVGKTREVEGIAKVGEKTAKSILSGFMYDAQCLIRIAEGHGNHRIREIYERREELLIGIELSDIFQELFGHATKEGLMQSLIWSFRRDRADDLTFEEALDLVKTLEMQSIVIEWPEWVGTFRRMIEGGT